MVHKLHEWFEIVSKTCQFFLRILKFLHFYFLLVHEQENKEELCFAFTTLHKTLWFLISSLKHPK